MSTSVKEQMRREALGYVEANHFEDWSDGESCCSDHREIVSEAFMAGYHAGWKARGVEDMDVCEKVIDKFAGVLNRDDVNTEGWMPDVTKKCIRNLDFALDDSDTKET